MPGSRYVRHTPNEHKQGEWARDTSGKEASLPIASYRKQLPGAVPGLRQSGGGGGGSLKSGVWKRRVQHPSNTFKIELCNNWMETGRCRYNEKCRFAHGVEELRVAPRIVSEKKWKTVMCRNYHEEGHCNYGRRCHFIHDETPEELALMQKTQKRLGGVRKGQSLAVVSASKEQDSVAFGESSSVQEDTPAYFMRKADFKELAPIHVKPDDVADEEKCSQVDFQESEPPKLTRQLSLQKFAHETLGWDNLTPRSSPMASPKASSAVPLNLRRSQRSKLAQEVPLSAPIASLMHREALSRPSSSFNISKRPAMGGLVSAIMPGIGSLGSIWSSTF